MKETIAFPKLVELVAQKANTTERMSELFLQELFAIVTQELADGKSVTIKGLGTFKVLKSESGKDVAFAPDRDIAEAVNAPFAQFVPVELCDEITDEMLSEIDAAMEQSSQNEDAETESVTPENAETSPALSQDSTKNEEIEPASSETHDDVATNLAAQEQKEPQEEPVPQDTKSRNPRTWFIAAAAAIALIAVWYFYTHRSKDRSDKEIETTQIAKKDTSTDAKDAKPQPVVTDTIGGNNVIFTMAKKHYGDQAFWVYIARENQAQYPDYRKIKRGSVLVIPPAEKYGINSDSKQSLKNANAEAMKLYKEMKAADENNVNSNDEVKNDEQEKTQTTKSTKKPAKKHSSRYSHHKKHQKRHYHR